MRVRGDLQPNNAFTLEAMPKRPGYVLVRFYENAKPFEDHQGDLTIKGYEYDEYHLEMEDTGGLETDVLNNYAALLAQAKALEPAEGGGDLEARVDTLERDKADRSDVQAVWDQMATAYSEGVQSA